MKKHYLFFLLSFYIILMYGQQQELHSVAIPDSLIQKTYDALEDHFNDIKYDFNKAALYARAYLKKSIIDKDVIKQANAYYFLSLIHKPDVSGQYADSIISLTEFIKDDTYPARGFLAKASALHRTGKYKEALVQTLKADKHATTNNNILQQLEVKHRMGLLKNDLKEHKEALDIFRTYTQIVEKQYKKDKSYAEEYIKVLFALGDSYNRNGKYDSAAIINKKGFEVSIKNKDTVRTVYFTMSQGITAYLEKNYDVSLDSIRKAAVGLKKRNYTGNLIVCYLYMGKIYNDQGKADEALPYFKKADSIAIKTSDFFPEIREAYNFLIDYYEKKKDTVNQLKYLITLKKVDAALDNNRQYLSDNIDEKYEKPKQRDQINKLTSAFNDYKLISMIGIVLLLIIIYYYYNRQRTYRIKFKALLDEKDAENKTPPLAKTETETAEDLNISETALNNIIEKLKVFINKRQFLNNNISLNNLAKSMETNPKYLSQFINFYEQKSFSAYITELRINYAIEELKTNTVFRKYSIRGIAEEVGFNNVQSFSKAFYKKTGIHPSYFIRNIEKEMFRRQNKNKMYSN